MIEYGRRSTLSMTNMNTDHKRKGRSKLYNIVENDLICHDSYDQMETSLYKQSHNFPGGDKMNTLSKLSLFLVISDICPLIKLCDTPDL